MERIRALIIDDEPLARKRIANLLKGNAEFEIIDECANGKEALSAIRKRNPDLIFLDVQMPDLDGFGVLNELKRDSMPVVIFVTAYDQYALQAFSVHALDYLLKPFDDERFEQALIWAKQQVQNEKISDLSSRLAALLEDYQSDRRLPRAAKKQTGRYLQRLALKSAGRVFFLKVEEIDWVEAEGYYIRLRFGKKSHLLRETMMSLEEQLDPAKFIRIHRSTIINLERVKELQTQSHGEYLVILQDGTALKLSRSYRDRLAALL